MTQPSTRFQGCQPASLEKKISQLEDTYVTLFLRNEDSHLLHRIHLELILLKTTPEQH